MNTKNKEKRRNKSVLLFSGGMDSVIFDKLLNPDILLYIPTGSIYEKIETEKILNLANNGIINKEKLIILNKSLNLNLFERDDLIVPNRNAYLILLASHFGETIYLGSVSGDRSFDKDKTFYKLMENLLNHIWQEQHWTEKREFKVSSPFKDYTKTELVKMYLEKGESIQNILKSYSCYSGKEQECGQCKPCVRKYVALVNNNIKIPKNYFKFNPLNVKWVQDNKKDILNLCYRGKEDLDFIKAYNLKPEN